MGAVSAKPVRDVVGKAEYKGRKYYVAWVGENKFGPGLRARLVSMDGKLDFWVNAVYAGSLVPPGKPAAVIVASYDRPRSLDGLRDYAARAAKAGPKPSGDCYLSHRGEWLVKGCYECRSLGEMCPMCRHDCE